MGNAFGKRRHPLTRYAVPFLRVFRPASAVSCSSLHQTPLISIGSALPLYRNAMTHVKNLLKQGSIVASALLMTTQLLAQSNATTDVVTIDSGKVKGAVKDGV